jgi:AmmeMemoRadiSam system protein A
MITYAALSPHPPIIVPEVGGTRTQDAEFTVKGLETLAAELANTKPDTVVFLTPHGNVFADCLTCLLEPQLVGNLEAFGGADVRTSHSNDLKLIQELGLLVEGQGITLVGVNREIARRHKLNQQLDHGIMVPLYYLEKAGLGKLPIVAISVGLLPNLQLYTFGKLIQQAAQILNKRVAIVASGDMSHRLKDEGPYDYHPDGTRYDLAIRDLIIEKDVKGILEISEKLRHNAGECGYPSILIMLGALDGYDFQPTIFSYEGPFGVGYLTVGINPDKPRNSILQELQTGQAKLIEARRANESAPVKWARMNLEGYLQGGHIPHLPERMEHLLKDRAGVFVSLKKHGQLRGCIGTFAPAYQNVAEEISHNALSAGLNDPRFSPVESRELPDLVYSVDILAPPEPCTKAELDPKRYGVIVSKGGHRGLLLPDLEGVDTVDEQLTIALQKGGISPRENYQIERFEVKRFT